MGETATNSVELVPDRAEAARYIAALAGSPDAVVTFQTFGEGAHKGDPSLNRVRHGTLATYWGELVNLNRGGAGIFVMVNEGDGKGRGAANVTALRAVFLDDDQGDLAPAALLLTPSIVVRSKAGLHVYWRLRPGEPLDSFTSTQEELADQYGTDASVKDLPRVLRLPGFLHLKDRAAPFPVRVVSTSPAVYSIDDVLPARRAGQPLHAATVTAPPRVRAVRAAGSFGQAVEAFNAANPWPDLPVHNRPGPCPVCGDAASFHESPADSGRWTCFSDDHPATVGRRKAACYWGDALDLWAHARGLTRREVLVADGFLEAGRQGTSPSRDGHLPDALAPETGLLSVSDIFSPLPPVPWLCEALGMAPGAPVLIAGYGYSGKTVAAQDFALAVATGTHVWGRFPVRAGRVLHLDYEQGSYLDRLRYQRLALARGIDPRSIDGRLVLAPMPGWYIDDESDEQLARLADGYDLAIIDSFRAACPHTDENSSDARVPLDRLTRISEKTGTTWAVIHHARKPSQNDVGGSRMSVRGSSALFDACGSILVFSGDKGEPPEVEHVKARITGRLHDLFQLQIEDVDTEDWPESGLRVSVLDSVPTRKQSPAERLQEVKARILDFVRDQGGTTGGTNVVVRNLGVRRDDGAAAIAELVHARLIVRGGTNRDPTLSLPGLLPTGTT